MQNKGFVKLFAILLALVCCFYLSFSFVTRHYESKAAEIAATEGEEAAGGGNSQLLLSGEIEACEFDLATGNLSGKASAALDADITLGASGGKSSFTICKEAGEVQTAVNTHAQRNDGRGREGGRPRSAADRNGSAERCRAPPPGGAACHQPGSG